MDAIELLTQDHDRVRDLAKRFEAAHERDDLSAVRDVLEEICQELDTHAAIEEEIFYPTVRDLGVEELSEVVAEGIQEHHVVKVLIREIRGLADSSDEELVAKGQVLIENVEHHASEEEDEMFPQVREHMTSEQLAAMGEELARAKSTV